MIIFHLAASLCSSDSPVQLVQGNTSIPETIRTKYRDVRSEVSMAVTMKNVVFWDIKTQFVLHRRHSTSPLQSPAG
jgi:hypothetical protein